MTLPRALALALGLALVPVPVLEPAAAGGPAVRAGEALRSKKQALGELRRQIEEAKARAEAARAREQALRSEMDRLDRDLATKRTDLSQLDQRIGRLEGELGRLTGRRGRVAEETVTQQAELAAQLRGLARLRAAPSPPEVLAGRHETVQRRAADDLARVVALGAARLAEFSETGERLAAREAAVSQGRRELVGLRGRVDAQRTAMSQRAVERRKLLANVRDDRATQEKTAADLAESARRLEALIRELGRRAQARAAVARPGAPPVPAGPAVGLGRERGELPWPIPGRIVAGFGPQVHPKFGTETVRRGIDIAAPEGTPIRAVSAGSVVYRGWLKGYGNLLILDHGQGYYTLYGHVSEVLADEGDPVKAGEPIARVGETGSAEGPRLYFEVRYQGRAEDPQAWLRRRP